MSFLKGKYLAITIGDMEVDISKASKAASKSSNPANTYEMGVVRPAPGVILKLDQNTVNDYSKNLGKIIPAGFSIEFKNALAAREIQPKTNKRPKTKKDLLAANFGGNIDLSNLPIAGKMFPKNESLIIEDLQVLICKSPKGLNHTEVADFESILPDGVASLPDAILKGINLQATLRLGDHTITLGTAEMAQMINGGAPNGSASNKGLSTKSNHQSKGNVNKTFGPVHIQSVHLGFTDGDLVVSIDASIAFGPLKLGFYELEIGSPINQFDPQFGLKGLSLDFHKNDLTIAGAFLNQGGGEYSGMFSLDLTKLQLTAIGSYKNENGHPSLFIYGLLNEPLGGPAFCFVEGVAAAFGYNRNFIAPPVSAISGFPLVSAAFNGNPQQSTTGLSTMMTDLDKYIPPKLGEYFVGLGLKFMSFKVINSFALLVVKFGNELEFDLLGESTYVAPNPKDKKPIAVVQLEIVGSYKPSLGTLLIRGQLTPNSFVLSKKCHLEGGFAIANWFKNPHKGDFVYTFGGYGQHFKAPGHYPQGIPQLGFLWQVDSDVSIKGGGYWAITPKVVVMGGYLLAAYSTSEIRASFEIDAYFKVNWTPLHYQASFTVTFSLSVYVDILFISGWIGFELSEGLDIHGPQFGGTAYIDLAVATVHINFGASPKPKPLLTGPQFAAAFLPNGPTSNLLNINIEKGLIKTEKDATGTEIYFINPKELLISTASFVPCTGFNLNSGSNAISPATTFEVAPMGIQYNGVTHYSHHKVTITYEGDPTQELSVDMAPAKEAPKSMWYDMASGGGDAGDMLSPLDFGTTITPGGTPDTGSATPEVARTTLGYESFNGKPFSWQASDKFSGSWAPASTYTADSINPDTYANLDAAFDFGIAGGIDQASVSERLACLNHNIYIGTISSGS